MKQTLYIVSCSIASWGLFCLGSATFMFLAPVLWLVLKVGGVAWPRPTLQYVSYRFHRWYVATLMDINRNVRFELVPPVNPVPVEGPAVIVSNHNSVIDLLMITSAFRGISVVGKRGFLFIPFFGLAMALNGMIFVDRRRRFESEDVFHLFRRRLRQGEVILVFPQGSRALPFSRKSVKRGLFKVILEERVPVIPVAISGTGFILGKGQFLFDLTRKLKVFVHILPPIRPEGDPESLADVTALRDRVVAAISDVVDRSIDLRRQRREA